MRRVLLAAALALAPFANAQQSAATNIHLRIFYAHVVHHALLTPVKAQMRLCAGCAPMAAVPMEVTASGGMLHWKNAAPAKAIFIDGELRASADEAANALHADTAGQWKVFADGDELRFEVTVPSERYVMAALAAEAAADEPMESLKALAIVIRTYAMESLHRHAAEGFDLCDSTHCQALRLGAVRSNIYDAVQSTLGETLYYGATRAQVFFTQNCGGRTESAEYAWGAARAKSLPYLQSHADPYCVRRGPSDWHTVIDAAQLADVLRKNGWNPPEKIMQANVVKHTPSGRAAMVELTGEGRPLRIAASDLRFALDRSLGWQQVRSDDYTIAVQAGRVIFTGHGYGHGVGLCQAGAWEMAATGSDAAAILKFYFPGTVVRIGPRDAGWHTAQGDGWSLMEADASHEGEMLSAGNAAWAQSGKLFPSERKIAPRVVMTASTELFRQATGAAGWTLAITMGDRIWLQPYAVMVRNGGVGSLLLHEMLHVRIEQEASAKAPLWLREGLVEALVAPAQDGPVAWHDLPAIEDALAHPQNLQQSERAHAAAAQAVRGCLARYGFSAVRGWLSSGVPSAVAADLRR